jgi:hypothetical protein
VALDPNINTREFDKFVDDAGETAVRVKGSISAVDTRPTVGTVENLTVTTANVEQSHALPANTKCFSIQTRGAGKLRLGLSSGQSSTSPWTIYAGGYYASPAINSASTSIYFQSPTAGLVLEVMSWS